MKLSQSLQVHCMEVFIFFIGFERPTAYQSTVKPRGCSDYRNYVDSRFLSTPPSTPCMLYYHVHKLCSIHKHSPTTSKFFFFAIHLGAHKLHAHHIEKLQCCRCYFSRKSTFRTLHSAAYTRSDLHLDLVTVSRTSGRLPFCFTFFLCSSLLKTKKKNRMN